MRKLKETERSHLLKYLSAEPDINMFFIGVVENHSLDSDEIAVYAEDHPLHHFCIVILKYFENYILYSDTDSYQVESVVNFLKNDIVDLVNGKANIIRRIAPFFPHMKEEGRSLYRLENLNESMLENSKVKVRILTPEDAGSIVELYAQNIEYGSDFLINKEKYIEERRKNLENDGIAVGLMYKNKLVSVAELSACHDMAGLVAGLATHPKYYGRGFATHALTALCEEALRRGKKDICVLHDNPKIMNILKNVGFDEKNQYALLH